MGAEASAQQCVEMSGFKDSARLLQSGSNVLFTSLLRLPRQVNFLSVLPGGLHVAAEMTGCMLLSTF